MTTEEK